MNALLSKEFMTLRSSLIGLVALGSLFALAFGHGSPSATCVIGVVMMSSVVGSSFSYDELYRWNLFAVSSGIARRDIVRMKFALGTIVVAIGLCMGLAMLLVKTSIDGTAIDVGDLIGGMVLAASLGMAMCSVNCLVNYVFDSSKAQIVSIALMIVMISAIVSLATLDMTTNIPWIGGVLVLLAASAISATSYRISMSRFQRKDL